MRWLGGEVERWRGGEVERWRGVVYLVTVLPGRLDYSSLEALTHSGARGHRGARGHNSWLLGVLVATNPQLLGVLRATISRPLDVLVATNSCELEVQGATTLGCLVCCESRTHHGLVC